MENTPVTTTEIVAAPEVQPQVVPTGKFTFTQENIDSILKGLAVALIGTAFTYMERLVLNTDFGLYTPYVVMINSVLVNIVRLYVKEG